MWTDSIFEEAFIDAGMWEPVRATIAFGGAHMVNGHMRVRAIDRLYGGDLSMPAQSQATDYDALFSTARFSGLNVEDLIDYHGVQYQVISPPATLRRGVHSVCLLKRLARVYPKSGLFVGDASPEHDMSPTQYIVRTAAQALGGHRIVRSVDVSLVDYADASNGLHGSSVLGFTTGASIAGGLIAVQNEGDLEFSGWSWTPNQPIWVGTNGMPTQVPPDASSAFDMRVAFAISPTKIFIEIEEPVYL